jgi:chemotaxis protein methyltransferase CheR
MLSNQQFDRTRRLALKLAGIELVERHRQLLDSRSRRAGLLNSAGWDSLLEAAEGEDSTAGQLLVRLLTTKFTGFFRHPRHFDLAAAHAVRAARRHGHVRLWSAGAATGEEPYSLAMALIEAFKPDDPPATILATDVDEHALDIAQRGEFSEAALKGLESGHRRRLLCENRVSGRWAVVSSVRRLVEFRVLNLAGLEWPVEGSFDVILCRNVLMYLETCHRYAVLERMASLLAADGLLMLDPSEHLGRAQHFFTQGLDGVYSIRTGTRRSAPTMSKV